jgi:hypothetical protein
MGCDSLHFKEKMLFYKGLSSGGPTAPKVPPEEFDDQKV